MANPQTRQLSEVSYAKPLDCTTTVAMGPSTKTRQQTKIPYIHPGKMLYILPVYNVTISIQYGINGTPFEATLSKSMLVKEVLLRLAQKEMYNPDLKRPTILKRRRGAFGPYATLHKVSDKATIWEAVTGEVGADVEDSLEIKYDLVIRDAERSTKTRWIWCLVPLAFKAMK
jgi:hypothetical protein